MFRTFALIYGLANYALFLLVSIYAVGFVGGFGTPTTLAGPRSESFASALMIDGLLIGLFGLQHSVMARPGFKRWWTRLVPEPLERSTYMLFTCAALGLLFWQWRPLGITVWEIEQPLLRGALWTLFAAGWLAVVGVSHLINHYDLFGLRQVWLYYQGQPYQQLPFSTPGPYRLVRHPLYVGWLIAFWCTPSMSLAQLVFALGMTVYILIAIRFEERDLMQFHAGYAAYRQQTPMLLPRLFGGSPEPIKHAWQGSSTGKAP